MLNGGRSRGGPTKTSRHQKDQILESGVRITEGKGVAIVFTCGGGVDSKGEVRFCGSTRPWQKSMYETVYLNVLK